MVRDDRRLFGAFVALLLLALLPVALPLVPPFFDVPNHLARVVILSQYDRSEFYRSFFTTNWQIIPNLALDVALLGLIKVFSPLVALKIYLGLIVILMTTGFAAFHRQIHGKWSLASYGGFTLVYTLSMFMGFMNFSMGIALLFILGAVYLALRRAPAPVRLLVAGLLAVVLFFTHLLAFLMAFLFFAFIVPKVVKERSPWRTWVELGVIAVVPILLYALASPTRGETGAMIFRGMFYKLTALFNLYRSGVIALDAVVMPLFLVGLVLLVWGMRARLASFARPLVACTTILFLIAPFGTKTTQVLDTRLPLFIVMAALLALPDLDLDRRLVRWSGVAVGFAIIVQAICLGLTYRAYDGDGRATTAFYAAHPEPSYVVQAWDSRTTDSVHGPFEKRDGNSAGLAVLSGDHCASALFAIPNQQPMLYRPEIMPIVGVVIAPNDPKSLEQAFAEFRTRLERVPRPPLPVYVQYAILSSQMPVAVPGSDLMVARPGLGIYRLQP